MLTVAQAAFAVACLSVNDQWNYIWLLSHNLSNQKIKFDAKFLVLYVSYAVYPTG